MVGIYYILNKLTGDYYIGSSSDMFQRFYNHKNALRRGKHTNWKLQKDWEYYGEETFEFFFLLCCELNALAKWEQNFIDALDPYYNIAKNASASMAGRQHSEETKQKMSDNHADFSGERNPMYGSVGTMTGKHHTEETKRKIAISNSVLTEDDVRDIKSLYATGEHSQRSLADRYYVSQKTIWLILNGKSWGHVA